MRILPTAERRQRAADGEKHGSAPPTAENWLTAAADEILGVMRRSPLAAVLAAAAGWAMPLVTGALASGALLGAGCAARTTPYRFASPMIGGADVPPPTLPSEAGSGTRERRRSPSAETLAHRGEPAHTSSARGVAGIEASPPPIASAEAADAVARNGVVWSRLPTPNRIPAEDPLPVPRAPTDLRALVGRRTKADPFELAIGWANALGATRDGSARDVGSARDGVASADRDGAGSAHQAFTPIPVPAAVTDHPDPPPRSSVTGRAIARAAATAQAAATGGLAGSQLLAWAREAHALHDLDETPEPGDLLVFDEIESDADADLIALVIARDDRGIAEFIYASGGVIRRGFCDANRPALRRDHEGRIVNTFMRSGRRWPPKGTHYLAGELLSHVIRAR